MRRIALSGILAAVLALTGITLTAESRPVLEGTAVGTEWCAQFLCGFAGFIGRFQGQLNGRDAKGFFSAIINHEDLPDVLQTSAITGGHWTITANRRILSGDVEGGTILNLNGTQYCVQLTIGITDGGRGELYFTGLLDHNPFPPTIAGLVTQEPLSCAALGSLTSH